MSCSDQLKLWQKHLIVEILVVPQIHAISVSVSHGFKIFQFVFSGGTISPTVKLLQLRVCNRLCKHQAVHKPAVWPCGKGSKWYPGLHYTKHHQVEGCPPSSPLSTGLATSGVLVAVSPVDGSDILDILERVQQRADDNMRKNSPPLSHLFSKLDSPSLFIKLPIKLILCF